MTPELAAEGTARDVVRVVQQARRDAGLAVSDRIRLTIGADGAVADAVRAHAGFVAAETLAVDLEVRPSAELGTDPRPLADATVKLALTRVSLPGPIVGRAGTGSAPGRRSSGRVRGAKASPVHAGREHGLGEPSPSVAAAQVTGRPKPAVGRPSGAESPSGTKFRRQKPTSTRRTKSKLTKPTGIISTTATGERGNRCR